MSCAESLRVQRYVDGELDAAGAREYETHLAQCPECRQRLQDLERMRATLKRSLAPLQAPTALRTRIGQALDAEDAAGGASRLAATPFPATPFPAARPPRRWPTFLWGSLAGAGATAAAAVIAFLVLALPAVNPVVDAVLAAHLTALNSAHQVEVVSTDQHTVKPWFAGRVAVSPVVADFADRGYRLAGGRVDSVDRQRAAVTVYQHGRHVIDVFCWAAPPRPLPANVTRRGYHLAFWRSGDLAYAAVSDTGWDELLGLERLLRSLASNDAPPRGP